MAHNGAKFTSVSKIELLHCYYGRNNSYARSSSDFPLDRHVTAVLEAPADRGGAGATAGKRKQLVLFERSRAVAVRLGALCCELLERQQRCFSIEGRAGQGRAALNL